MFLYQITDENLNPLRVVKSPRGLVAYDGTKIDNATSMTINELADLYIFVIGFPDHPNMPDPEWQIVTGHNVNIVGVKSKPREVVCTLEYQVQDITIDQAKSKLISQVKNHALQVQDGGYLWEKAPGESYVVDTKLQDRVNIVGLDNMAKDGDLANQLKFSMADNQEVPLTDAEFMALAKAVGVFVITVHGIKKAKIKAIKLLPNLDACKDYNPQADFPPIPEIDSGIEP
ncbi:hypothetical protein [uncultured Kiloniella sp.]|uniref:DUF4376 domain-containing protein n=1 Tax=uncultured Kiloniella sp. TaxID=1133091 RepID=UPI00262797D7|nr:hypothetical protein [uncultured Kiloniella sp.]